MGFPASRARSWLGRRRSPGRRTAPMAEAPYSSTQIQLRLDRLRAGDESARDELLDIACERLGRLARKMLRGYPGVRRWEQTDDVAPERRAAALAGPRRGPARVGARLHPPGRGADPPRADRPGAALRRAGGPGASSRRPGRIGRLGEPPGPPDAADRHGRPGPAGGLDRVPRAGRGAARRGDGRSSTCCGIRACPRPRPPRCWASPSGW